MTIILFVEGIINDIDFAERNLVFFVNDAFGNFGDSNDAVGEHEAFVFNLVNETVAGLHTGAIKFGGMHMSDQRNAEFFFGQNAKRPTLTVDAMGLDILIDKYGKRVSVNKMYLLNEQDDWLDSQQRQMYEVTLKGIIHYDWYELISLCLKHPHEIKIKEPTRLIDGVITSLERLNEY